MVSGALFAAGKVEETPCRINDIINVLYYLRQRRRNEDTTPLDGFNQASKGNDVVPAHKTH
jgi:hypothetical protein